MADQWDTLNLKPLNATEKKHAPGALYFAGDESILDTGFRISIVGSREASPAGLKRARRLAAMIVERGGVVVSGLAKGIDTAAHRSAIEMGGKTVAVIGTPLDKVYPRENASLQHEIMREHLCVSQFAPGQKVYPSNFPLRNRTMALLSDATVIVEAGATSGSISQGWEALRLGRGLFIAASLVQNKDLEWPAKMLAYGAEVLSEDTIENLFGQMPERGVSFSKEDLNSLVFA